MIQAAVIGHPDGVILFDTGTADDHPLIADLYRPAVVPLVEALNAVGVDERDVTAIVNSHLHFDHCGQNRVLPRVPVWVQRSEYALVDEPLFTVPDWARLEPHRRRLIDGDAELAPGVRIIATPGHTPGHQSLVIDDGRTVTVLAGQCCYDCGEFTAGAPALADLHEPPDLEMASNSIRRLHSLSPDVVHLSHDPTIWSKTT